MQDAEVHLGAPLPIGRAFLRSSRLQARHKIQGNLLMSSEALMKALDGVLAMEVCIVT